MSDEVPDNILSVVGVCELTKEREVDSGTCGEKRGRLRAKEGIGEREKGGKHTGERERERERKR